MSPGIVPFPSTNFLFLPFPSSNPPKLQYISLVRILDRWCLFIHQKKCKKPLSHSRPHPPWVMRMMKYRKVFSGELPPHCHTHGTLVKRFNSNFITAINCTCFDGLVEIQLVTFRFGTFRGDENFIRRTSCSGENYFAPFNLKTRREMKFRSSD